MFEHNLLLQEAVEKSFSPTQPAAEFKKLMNTCQLTKYKSIDNCGKFYSAFFLNQAEGLDTVDKWSAVYMELLNDVKFVNNLCNFMAMFQPADATGMFQPIIRMMDSSLEHMEVNRIRMISDTKSLFTFLQMKFNSITDTVRAQVKEDGVCNFCCMWTLPGMIDKQIYFKSN